MSPFPARAMSARFSEAGIEQTLELLTAANRIGDRKSQSQRLARQQLARLRFGQARGVEAHAAATDLRVGAPSEAQVHVDGFLDARQRELIVSEHTLASRLVAHHDDIGLAAVE